jgi:guanylate kinase
MAKIIISSIWSGFVRWFRRGNSSNGRTSLAIVMARPTLGAGRDVLFDIDWQGAQQLYQQAGGDVVRVFILPPSMEELHRRLAGRATDSAEVVEARMSRAGSEIAHWDGYDYVLVNDDVDRCFGEVKTILAAERLKRSRQTSLIGFIRGLTRPS